MAWELNQLLKKGAHIITSCDDPLWGDCETLEFEVFKACNYIEHTGKYRIDDFDDYQASVFVLSKGRDLAVTGASRLVLNSSKDMQPGYFPTLACGKCLERSHRSPAYVPGGSREGKQTLFFYPEAWENILKIPARRCLDAATMAVAPEQRDTKAWGTITSRTLTFAWEHSIRYLMLAADSRVFEKLLHRGLPFAPLGPAVEYWGSPTIPALLDTYRVPGGLARLLIPAVKLKKRIGGIK
ncbi:MAG: hypothetical protein MI802_06535 [Desulfobacterales bacterium]|nr:hypothetical protein [Desulfobacterales bacterium]